MRALSQSTKRAKSNINSIGFRAVIEPLEQRCLLAGLLGHWTLDDATAMVATDASGNRNDGVLQNGPTWSLGRIGGGLRFDGRNDFVAVPDAPILNPANEVSLTAWFKSDDVGVGGIIVSKGDLGGQFHLRVFQNRLRFRLTTTDGIASFEPNFSLSDDTWYHIAGVYDGSVMTLYVDGNELGSQRWSGQIVPDSVGVTLGRRSGSSVINHFDGTIDDVRVYDCALSVEDIGNVMSPSVDRPGIVQFSLRETSVDEDSGTASIRVRRLGGRTGLISVDYEVVGVSATASVDFTPSQGTLRWGDGEQADRFISISLENDTAPEGDEIVAIVLSNVSGGATLADQSTATITIRDDDGGIRAGLVGHWALDDESGTIARDSSGRRNDGDLLRGPRWTTGRLVGGLSFDGRNDYVAVPNDTSLNPTTALTLSAWFNSNDIAAGGIVVSKGDLGNQYHLRVFQNRLRFRLSTTAGIASFEPNFAFSDDTWYHIAGVFDGSRMTLFVDGNEIGSQRWSGNILPDGVGLTLGRRSGSSVINHFDGVIDDVLVYTRALDATEIVRLSGGGTEPPAILGDIDGDGMVAAPDIDGLCRAVETHLDHRSFDLNDDGIVNNQDVSYLVEEILGTGPGDANLDRVFDSRDLVQVFQAGEYEDGSARNSTWADGDWNCDREFNTADLVTAFQSGSYVAGANPTVKSVDVQLRGDDRIDRSEFTDRSVTTKRNRIEQLSVFWGQAMKPLVVDSLFAQDPRAARRSDLYWTAPSRTLLETPTTLDEFLGERPGPSTNSQRIRGIRDC